ncbi:unnamed protein product, partial [Polarella glacialis]
MIPLGSGPQISGPPTDEMLATLRHVKWCVLATYACVVGRFLADDPFGAINDLFGGLFGTFLLKEDPQLAGCYKCLQDSPLGSMSEGGLGCLMPYLFMAGLNGIFSALRLYTIASRFGTLLPCTSRLVCFLPIWLLGSCLSQIGAASLCWQ